MRLFPFFLGLAALPALADNPLADFGQALFFDPNLSLNGTQSCASCHDPAAGFAASDAAANLGGGVVEGDVKGRFGNRKPPALAYSYAAPPLHHTMEDGAPLFLGGAFHDGRATGDVTGSVLGDQAMQPFLNPAEMAMPDAASVVARVCAAHPELTGFDSDACTPGGVDGGFVVIAKALAAYEASSAVNPFSSRFDAWRAGKGSLTAQELAGFALFQDRAKCAACHITDPGPSGEPALFTDFTYDNLGVPRNPANPWYGMAANPLGSKWVDLGLAVTLKADPIYAPFADSMRGKIKVPTLRNVAAGADAGVVRAYTHNGYFKTLEGVVRFYNTRDVWPACTTDLPEAQALAQKCWPVAEVPETVNHDELGNLHLSEADEAAIVAFLKTLTDG